MNLSMKEIIHAAMRKEYAPARVLSRIFAARLNVAGVGTTAADLSRLEKSLESALANNAGQIDVPLGKKRLAKAGITADLLQKLFAIPSDKEIDEHIAKLEKALPTAAVEATQAMGSALIRYVMENGRDSLDEHRQRRLLFESNLQEIWGGAFDRLEILIGVSREIATIVDSNWRNQKRRRRTPEMILAHRFQARAICIADEILVLLKSGLAGGAVARWRSLHELAVVATVVGKFKGDIAERYVSHSAITRYQATLVYQENAAALGFKPISAKTVERNLKERDRVVSKYGVQFKEAYGWASEVLGRPAKKFDDIEKLAGMSALRPFYKHASKAVHGGAQGTLEPEGLRKKDTILLAGPSNYGLADAGQLTANSLTLFTQALMAAQQSFDTLPFRGVMNALAKECAQAFMKAHRAVEALAREDDKRAVWPVDQRRIHKARARDG